MTKETTKQDESTGLSGRVDPVVMLHRYQARHGCQICSRCGAAKHKSKLDGFKYWFAGVGYEQEPPCRKAA